MGGKLNEIFDSHIVTAGEAAAAALYGVYAPRTRWQWMANLAVGDEREDWELLALECYLSTAAGVDYHGKIISLLALPMQGATIHMIPQTTRCQYAGQRVALRYPTYLDRGFAVLIVNPVLTAGDIIRVTGLYRRVE
jgi:hypothetical protein